MIDKAVTEREVIDLIPIPYSSFAHADPVKTGDIIFIEKKIEPRDPSIISFFPNVKAFLVAGVRDDKIAIKI